MIVFMALSGRLYGFPSADGNLLDSTQPELSAVFGQFSISRDWG